MSSLASWRANFGRPEPAGGKDPVKNMAEILSLCNDLPSRMAQSGKITV
jgi:hypothetical protein